ncbi:tail fiber domain-containing protein [Candidatus Acetothermia bacterium]|nr:tail fiber domain-containing protein [Candidatus Acetothermia bacterium]
MLQQRWFGGLVFGLGIALILGLSVLASPMALTVTSYSDLVRFEAQGSVTELRVQIFSLAGQPLVDSGFVRGSALDWRLGDQRGRLLGSGVYLYALSLKDAAGKVSQHLGKLVLLHGKARLGAAPVLTLPSVGALQRCTIDCEPPASLWQELLDQGEDNFRLLRSGVTLLTLDNVGRLSVSQVCLTGDCRSVWPVSGTVTSVGTGSGLSGGPITTSGTISVDTGVIQARVTGTCATVNAIRVIDGTGAVTCETIPGPFSGWMLAGNSGTTPATNFLGTTDNVAFEVRVNNVRALRLEPASGGVCNTICPNVIGGFSGNRVTAGVFGATISGGGLSGNINSVTANFGTVGGGINNTASGFAATVGGGANNTASGLDATVGGGAGNIAAGDFSFVVGFRAKNTNAAHDGVFIFADSTPADFPSTAANEFAVRASGGTRIFSNTTLTAGVTLAAGASAWASVSDRALKENFKALDGREVLHQLSLIPITEWNYKAQAAQIRHIGPMAQDFYAAFGLGESDKTISTIDADGIALISIQALYELSLEKDKQIEELKASNDELTKRVEKLEKLVQELSKK